MSLIQKNYSLEKLWLERLSSPEYGQTHVVQRINNNYEKMKFIVTQFENIKKTYPGGLLQYIKNARELLNQVKNNINLYDGYTPKFPKLISLSPGTTEFSIFEQIGLNELDKVVFVLVAGGMGERLGYPGIKLELPIETITNTTYLEYYIQMILSCQNYIETRDSISDFKIPLAIMTSDDTHEKTLHLLESNNYFNFPKDQLYLLKQETVPSLIDTEANLALVEDKQGFFKLDMKPHGHGDIHTLLHQRNLPSKWLSENKKWLIFFQDTNALVLRALCPLLGVSKQHHLVMNSLSVLRKPGEAMGAICSLSRAGALFNNNVSRGLSPRSKLPQKLTINVEYNQLHSLLVASGFEQGDTPDTVTGCSPFPGNTNILCLDLHRYFTILSRTEGTIPEFINPKYSDASKKTFKTFARLECMMQDLPKAFDSSDAVGTTQLDRWFCFSSVKNNVRDAAMKSKLKLPPECPFSAESDLYYANARLLEIAAREKCTFVKIPPPVPTTFSNVEYMLGPKIILSPYFGITLEQIKNRIQGGSLHIAQTSTLVLDGNVQLNGLEVDGAVLLKTNKTSQLHIYGLKIQNEGVHLDAIDENSTSSISALIRGYQTNIKSMTQLLSLE